MANNAAWNREAAEELYGVRGWGDGYFRVAADGSVVVRARGNGEGPEVSILEVVHGLKARGIDVPVLLRFVDILTSRIRRLNDSFPLVNRLLKANAEVRVGAQTRKTVTPPGSGVAPRGACSSVSKSTTNPPSVGGASDIPVRL